MRILGIESSCDETSAGVVQDFDTLLSNVVVSQIDIHKAYGGVVPEVAARSHLEAIMPVVDKAMLDAGCTWDDIDGISVTNGPGLGGSLLIGVMSAKTLAMIHNKPLYPCHHVLGHIYANWLVDGGGKGVDRRKPLTLPLQAGSLPIGEDKKVGRAISEPNPGLGSNPLLEVKKPVASALSCLQAGGFVSSEPNPKLRHPELVSGSADIKNQKLPNPGLGSGVKKISNLIVDQDSSFPKRTAPKFPVLSLVVSGKHTHLYWMRDHFDIELLGKTTDDAVGEAFDKVAKLIGLPYPGGPSIAEAALGGNKDFMKLPMPKTAGEFDFSFSGLKTVVLRSVQRLVGVDINYPSWKLAELLSPEQVKDVAASFQAHAVRYLVNKTDLAVKRFNPASLVIGGGVACSEALRAELKNRIDMEIDFAPPILCTDNGGMIAAIGCYKHDAGLSVGLDEVRVDPGLKLG